MPADPYVPTHGSASYDVERYELTLDYRLSSNRLAARARIFLTAVRDLSSVRLDLANLRVTKVMMDGVGAVRYQHRGHHLHVSLPAVVETGRSVVLDVHYGGLPRPLRGICGEVGWEELEDGVLVAGQPDGAPSWFPCNDRPSNKASYRIEVTTESAYRVVATGELVDRQMKSSRTTWTFEQAEPMATYLAAVHIGRYQLDELDALDAPAPSLPRTRSRSGSASRTVSVDRLVPLRVAMSARLRDRSRADLGREAAMVELFADRFGPYPFGSYTVVVTDDDLEIPLEAQGMAVFGANHLDGRRTEERLVAHELAHQWFGNSLTPAAWQHVWLNEGFACYSEWLWSEASGGRSADGLAEHHWQRVRSQAFDLVLANPGVELLFDDRVYKRGALALHELRRVAGDDVFFAIVRDYVATNRYGVVTTGHFLAAVDRHTTSRLTGSGGLLDRWLHHLELPPLTLGA